MSVLLDQPLRTVLDTLASSAPTPGGGSAAAITGAMAAGLLTMVCDLTIGRKAYAGFDTEARTIRARAEALRLRLQDLAHDDIAVFTALSAAYRLEKTTDAARSTRAAAIQYALQAATIVPLAIAEAAAAVLPLGLPLAESGSRLAVSDVGVAAHLARAAVPAALLSVAINLAQLDDADFIDNARQRMAALHAGLAETTDAILARVAARVAS